MKYTADSIYAYIDEIRNNHFLDKDLVEDICLVVIYYHMCGCRDRIYTIEEIVESCMDDSNWFYGEMYFRHGLEAGTKVNSSMIRLICRAKFIKNISVFIIDLKFIPDDIEFNTKKWIHLAKTQGVALIDSSKENIEQKINTITLNYFEEFGGNNIIEL